MDTLLIILLIHVLFSLLLCDLMKEATTQKQWRINFYKGLALWLGATLPYVLFMYLFTAIKLPFCIAKIARRYYNKKRRRYIELERGR